MNKAEKTITLLRETADVLDSMPLRLKGLLGPINNSENLRKEADFIEVHVKLVEELKE